jgi:hypothetical protein
MFLNRDPGPDGFGAAGATVGAGSEAVAKGGPDAPREAGGAGVLGTGAASGASAWGSVS